MEWDVDVGMLAQCSQRPVRPTWTRPSGQDVCKRAVANDTAQRIREELSPYCDVDIMYLSGRRGR